MKIGKGHRWKYKHLKTIDKGKTFKIYQVKKRSRPSPKGSGMPKKSKLVWNIKARQTTKKVKGGYLITLKGYKGQGAYKLPKKKWIKSKRKM